MTFIAETKADADEVKHKKGELLTLALKTIRLNPARPLCISTKLLACWDNLYAKHLSEHIDCFGQNRHTTTGLKWEEAYRCYVKEVIEASEEIVNEMTYPWNDPLEEDALPVQIFNKIKNDMVNKLSWILRGDVLHGYIGITLHFIPLIGVGFMMDFMEKMTTHDLALAEVCSQIVCD